MFSSFGSTNPYGGRVNLKRHLFGKKKTPSIQSEGLDLKKVKGQHCVETWATHYDHHHLSSETVQDVLLASPASQDSLAHIIESQLALSEAAEGEADTPGEESRLGCYPVGPVCC